MFDYQGRPIGECISGEETQKKTLPAKETLGKKCVQPERALNNIPSKKKTTFKHSEQNNLFSISWFHLYKMSLRLT